MRPEQTHVVYRKVIKRILDFVLSLLGIIILLIPMAVIALLVRIKLGSPVIFGQERPGKDRKLFRMYKFRSMTDERGSDGELLPDADRLTPFGKKLRALSLDELPELFNVLKGDMSLVGPRPFLKKYLPLYNEEQNRRHEVRPGMTGLAQTKGRNLVDWQERFRYDVYYVDHLSFMLDLKIVFKTLSTVLKREGIHSGTSETMEEFTGNKEGGNPE
ncbi:MAG: sugar transferase [Clostridia bacterium]|jgi:undecaprenyl phosphate N,N'-diacetylbacillosamine 1-phosphate transferase|nr:sugar transferase [Clostridia bacterium]